MLEPFQSSLLGSLRKAEREKHPVWLQPDAEKDQLVRGGRGRGEEEVEGGRGGGGPPLRELLQQVSERPHKAAATSSTHPSGPGLLEQTGSRRNINAGGACGGDTSTSTSSSITPASSEADVSNQLQSSLWSWAAPLQLTSTTTHPSPNP